MELMSVKKFSELCDKIANVPPEITKMRTDFETINDIQRIVINMSAQVVFFKTKYDSPAVKKFTNKFKQISYALCRSLYAECVAMEKQLRQLEAKQCGAKTNLNDLNTN